MQPVVLDPLVPGWSPVRSVKRAAVYDVPPSWQVLTETTIVGYETEQGQRVAASGAAEFGTGACGSENSSLAARRGQARHRHRPGPGGRGDRSRVGRPGLPRRQGAPAPAHRRPAGDDHHPGRAAGRAGQGDRADRVPGRRLQADRGAVYAISATGFTGELGPTAILVVVADIGRPDAVPEAEIRQILGTLRPA